MPPDALEALGLKLDNLSLSTPSDNNFVGADIPVNCRMIIRGSASGVSSDQVIELWERKGPKPAVKLAIHRPSGPRRRGRSTKAVAVLVRGASDPIWTAVSGWDANRPRLDAQVSASESLVKVKKMCIAIDHDLSPHTWDQGEAGRYHACHAEKQLLACLFEPRQPAAVTARKKHARIHQTLEPCDDCHRCLKAFVVATGITVTVFVHGDNDGMVSHASIPAPRRMRYLKGGIVKRSLV